MIDEKKYGSLPRICILNNNLCQLYLCKSDALHVLSLLKNRIRRITWLDEFSTHEAHECHRISKMCYELVLQLQCVESNGNLCLTNMSSEDVDILLNFPKHWRTEKFKEILGHIRENVREAGPVSPIEQDRFSKEFIDVMEG